MITKSKAVLQVIALSLALPLALPLGAVAGEAPLLDQWRKKALDQNQQVQSARKGWDAAQQRIRAGRSLNDPMVGVDFMRADHTRFDDFDETEYMVSQRFPWFGKRSARVSEADLRAQAEGFRYLDVMRSVRTQVTEAYWSLWLADKNIEITSENRALLASFEDIARARYASGIGIEADVLRAQVELAALDNDLETLRAARAVAQARINRLLSEDMDVERKVPESVPDPTLRWTLEEAYRDARNYCCILLAYVLDLQAAGVAVRSARLERAPDIEVRVAARQMRGRSSIDSYDTGIAINVPWLWRGKYQAGIAEAENMHKQADAALQNEIDMTLLEVAEAHTAAQTAQRTLALYEETILPRTEALLASTRSAYENGEVGFLEVIDAQRQWIAARLATARTRAEFGSSVARLDEQVEPWHEYELDSGIIPEGLR